MPFYRPTVAEINLDALTHNVLFFRERLPVDREIIAVVKADAYGHGVIPVAKHLSRIGIKYLAVAFLDEAIQLRQAGITEPILVLGYTPPEGVEAAFAYDITLTIFSKPLVETIQQVGKRRGKSLKVHIKVDTGMGRIGLLPDEVYHFVESIKYKNELLIEGIFTHFAAADDKDKTFTLKQYDRMTKVLEKVRKIYEFPIVHVSNSAGMIDLPYLTQTMSRLGVSLYGLLPSSEVSIGQEALQPVMTLKTKVSHVKTLSPGQTVSYGATFKAEKETVVATIPIGYADGFQRQLSNQGYVMIHGKKAPIIGRICMDQTMIDVTLLNNVHVDDEVVIYGKQGENQILMDDNASLIHTINYEIATMIGKRVPRIYKRDGETIERVNPLL